jgi:hypothetical protein
MLSVVTALSPLAELRELSLAHNPCCSSSSSNNSNSSSATVAAASTADTPRRSTSTSSGSSVWWKQRAVAELLPAVLRFDDVDTDVVSCSTMYIYFLHHIAFV